MRSTQATLQTTESETQVATASCHVMPADVNTTTMKPAVTTKPPATARRHSSKSTVANDAVTTAQTAAIVYS